MPTPSARAGFAPAALVAALMALALCSGCRNEPQIVVRSEVDPASDVEPPAEMAVSINSEAPEFATAMGEMPSFAPVYPGATVKTRMGRPQEDGEVGSLLVMETADSVETVAAFYDAQARKSGITPSMFVNEADSAVRIFGGKDGPNTAGGALIAISKSDEGPGTEIVITAGLADRPPNDMEPDTGGGRPTPRPDVRLQ